MEAGHQTKWKYVLSMLPTYSTYTEEIKEESKAARPRFSGVCFMWLILMPGMGVSHLVATKTGYTGPTA